ncbi:hypothetical protein EK904_003867 [Melospiza melodia maxima]|nr:hypothetical protein EK904_003867 [Melospiza melodia maxima]
MEATPGTAASWVWQLEELPEAKANAPVYTSPGARPTALSHTVTKAQTNITAADEIEAITSLKLVCYRGQPEKLSCFADPQEIYWTNPQFKIQLDEPNDDHEGSLNEPCLMQKNHRRQKRMEEGLLSIGYLLYQRTAKGLLTKPCSPQLESSTDVHAGHAFFARHQPAAWTDPCVNLHEVSSHMMLPRGQGTEECPSGIL